MTLAEVIGGHVQVTFVARKAALWDAAPDNGEKVVLRSRDVNIADRDWHRIEITRYSSYIIHSLLSELGLRARFLSYLLVQ